MKSTITQKIIDSMLPYAEGLTIADVRIGIIYTSVSLSNGKGGVAWTGRGDSAGCHHLSEAGTFAGRPAEELLRMIEDPSNPVFRTIGLATANALSAGTVEVETSRDDILDIIDIQGHEHVVMVGFFAPLVSRIRKTGCTFDIVELNSDKPGTISPEEGRPLLGKCDVAILTGTSIVTDTQDQLICDLGQPRAAVILGPSSFMFPAVYKGTPITHIAGSRVIDSSAVERIVSEGGGTRTLKKHMSFETVSVPRQSV